MSIDQLALLGGEPAFAEPRVMGRPNLGDREALFRRLSGALERGWLTNGGPLVQELEEKLAERLAVRHCITVCNATIGLELGLKALELEGEVVVPAFTFIATAHAASWVGLDVRFCDVDPATHLIDLDSLEQAVSERTSAVVPVHLWGAAAPVDALESFCEERGLRLIFDAAHAFACTAQGRTIGRFGDLEVFSFHATKFFNAFEGGAVTTEDDDLADRLRAMRNFGGRGAAGWGFPGTNAKMSEASAAMGLTSLEILPEIVARNRENHDAYREELASVPGIALRTYDPGEENNHQYVVVEVDGADFGLTADELVEVLAAENVGTRRYFVPGLHQVPPYRDDPSTRPVPLPVTEQLSERCLLLPSGLAVTPTDARSIARCIIEASARAEAVQVHLRQP
ncbi:MAG: aminotransferase class I/II-fold pyridoxal phosphate-dependent enzyme [Deltaproteobacteria bacterium]|nr:aminotransferase class I/II-fold pyridoxal phosphate-dependent enzyme [Deltaproteobacteria bacterium]